MIKPASLTTGEGDLAESTCPVLEVVHMLENQRYP